MFRAVSHRACLACGFLTLAGMLAAVVAPPAAAQGAKKSESVVRAKVAPSKPDADGKQSFTVTLTMDKNWHTYANSVPPDFPGLPTTITVTGKTKPEDVKVDYPKGKLVMDSTVGDHHIYDDTVDIKVTLQRAKGDTGPLDVSIKVQACSDKQCLLPSTLKLNVP